ncbi:hypothetical protein PINS_up019593 [Pythium insidiosum]|nr:hypothetical protein PINS_up019593 [Pythium insidiosum]
MTRVPVASLRALACKYGVVSLRGFKQDDDLVQVAERVGPVLEWPFGKVFEIKSVADTALTGQTREAMPMHYDGLFKKKHPDSTELGDVWLYQLFHCVEAYPSQEGDNSNGRTLFTHTRRLLADLTEAQRERLRKATLVYYSGILGNDHLVHVSPVIIPHPVTGEEIVRFPRAVGSRAHQDVPRDGDVAGRGRGQGGQWRGGGRRGRLGVQAAGGEAVRPQVLLRARVEQGRVSLCRQLCAHPRAHGHEGGRSPRGAASTSTRLMTRLVVRVVV